MIKSNRRIIKLKKNLQFLLLIAILIFVFYGSMNYYLSKVLVVHKPTINTINTNNTPTIIIPENYKIQQNKLGEYRWVIVIDNEPRFPSQHFTSYDDALTNLKMYLVEEKNRDKANTWENIK